MDEARGNVKSAIAASRTPADLLRNYIRAKDENRPHLISEVFHESACLEMRVKTDSISFPSVSQGAAAIAEVLSSRFNQNYENIYTFYLDRPPADTATPPAVFACDWLVGMSEKNGGNVRVGCGRYEWIFRQEMPLSVESLYIVIEEMQVLPAKHFPAVLAWLLKLEYPWSSATAVCAAAPAIEQLKPVLHYLNRNG